MIQQLLTEDAAQVAAWRTRLTTALGSGASVLAEVVPEVASIIGPQPRPRTLGPAETQNRFRLVFQNFLQALARREHPLVVFLDDLQWADSATLNLLEPLLAGADIESLLLIGAYRDDGDADPSPQPRACELETAGVVTRRLPLEPLALPDLINLVRDTLHCGPEDAEPLAGLVSPEDRRQSVLRRPVSEGAEGRGAPLSFDYERERWTFESDAIAKAGMTGNVIDLMTRKIQRLSADTQRALTLAACIGNPFDLHTLAIVSDNRRKLRPPTSGRRSRKGLVLYAAPGTAYAFLHDRVQQSAYALIPDRAEADGASDGRPPAVAAGRAEQGDERMFDIVHHLNLGRGLIDGPGGAVALASLNLSAGQKAKSATAHDAALGYLHGGARMVTTPVDQDYDFAFALHLEAAECQ